ncbi:sialin-like [Oratosquilla oratoria]|uniref:sialin-like n=1 Tax=Oratosquilla oratoria TaxID=337810 RepID=UPI003F76463F
MELCGVSDRIPTRLTLGFLVLLGMMNLFISRVNLSVIIVAIVGPVSEDAKEAIRAECLHEEETVTPYEMNHADGGGSKFSSTNTTSWMNYDVDKVVVDWDEYIQGIVLGCFYWGYVITQVPGGRLAELYGTKLVYGLTIMVGGWAAFLSPWAIKTHYFAFIALRIIQGLCQGPSWPSVYPIVARWIPREERSTFMGISFYATNLGVVLGLPLCSYVIAFLGWEAAFYVSGFLSILWCLLWALLVFESPDKHPRISKEELEYIQTCIKATGTSNYIQRKSPWKSILLSRPVWVTCITDFCGCWGLFLFLTKMPSYVKNVLGYPIAENGVVSAMPFLVRYTGSVISGFVNQQLLKKKVLSLNKSRRIAAAIGLLIPAVCVLGVAYAGCQPTVALTLLSVGMFFNGFVSSGHVVNMIDIAPNHAGTLAGMSNFFGCLPGFLTPYTTGLILGDGHTMARWKHVFWLCASMYVTAGFLFIFCASTEVQPWNNSNSETENSAGTEELKNILEDKKPQEKELPC